MLCYRVFKQSDYKVSRKTEYTGRWEFTSECVDEKVFVSSSNDGKHKKETREGNVVIFLRTKKYSVIAGQC